MQKVDTYRIVRGIDLGSINQQGESYFHWRRESRWVSLPLFPSHYFCWSAPGLPQRCGCQLPGRPWTYRCMCPDPGPQCSQSCKKWGERRKRSYWLSALGQAASLPLSCLPLPPPTPPPAKCDQFTYLSQLNVLVNICWSWNIHVIVNSSFVEWRQS